MSIRNFFLAWKSSNLYLKIYHSGFNRWTLSQKEILNLKKIFFKLMKKIEYFSNRCKGDLSVNINNGLSPAAEAHLRIPYRFSTNAANSETFDNDQKKIIKDSRWIQILIFVRFIHFYFRLLYLYLIEF